MESSSIVFSIDVFFTDLFSVDVFSIDSYPLQSWLSFNRFPLMVSFVLFLLHSTDLSINFAFDDLHCWRALFALFLQSLVVNLLTPLSANQSEFILTKSRFSSQYASIHMVARFSKTKTIGILKIDRKSNNLITLNASDSAPEFQSHNRTIMGAEWIDGDHPFKLQHHGEPLNLFNLLNLIHFDWSWLPIDY